MEPTELLEPIEYSKEILSGFKKKADKQKNISFWVSIISITCAFFIPFFLLLDSWWQPGGKIFAALLSVISSVSATWLQFKKPLLLWSVYRDAQRKIEQAMAEYKFGEKQKNEECKDRLAKQISEIAYKAHEQWIDIAPTLSDMSWLDSKNKGGR